MLKVLDPGRWDFATAAHLLNRAGFGGTPDEIQRLVALGPAKAVSSLVDVERIPDPTPNPSWARPDPERLQRLAALRQASPEQRQQMQREEQQLQRERLLELRGWWLERMAKGPRPLQEKMTLFWHRHFATSFQKVRDAYYMWRQNDLFRRFGLGNWTRLLVEVGKDPAMLIWLDQAQSRRQHPNENFARELMELFTLGEGHYTEKDVTEAARALTGWSLNRQTQEFVYRRAFHDNGVKTILGRTGNFDGDDVIRILVAQPQAALFITAKLWTFFAGESPSPELNQALADVFRRNGNEFKPLLRALFLSEEFYSPHLIRQQVKSPVQWLAGSVRMLERDLPPAQVCANLLRTLGQDLFAPPNVKGWDEGFAWISTSTLLARYNYSALLAEGVMAAGEMANRPRAMAAGRRMANRARAGRTGAVDVRKILTDEERRDKTLLLGALQKRLLQSNLKPKQERALREYLESKGDLDDDEIRGAMRLIMSTPEYQLT